MSVLHGLTVAIFGGVSLSTVVETLSGEFGGSIVLELDEELDR
jgi:hypothetical protein